MKKFKQKIWLSALVVAVSGTIALADVFTVSNDPSIPAQYSAIADAVDAADDGDTILIKATRYSYGTYNLFRPMVFLGEGYNPNKDITTGVMKNRIQKDKTIAPIT